LFIDFWNFQLMWRDRTNGAFCDWQKVPGVLAATAQATAAQLGQLRVDDTRIYTSVNPGNAKDATLRRWLDTFLNRQPGFRVFIRERKPRRKPIHCNACYTDLANCPACNAPYQRAIEKGVDTAIVTDMFSLAWEGAYEVALLVSGDADLIPGVEEIQDRGLKVINATWLGHGNELAKACWASFSMDPLIPQLLRAGGPAAPA
jgi:uncharacterized LabA/DUF88 family protein